MIHSRAVLDEILDTEIEESKRKSGLSSFLGYKIQALLKLLKWIKKRDPNEKSLIFTTEPRMVRIIHNELEKHKIQNIKLIGSQEARAKKFKTEPMKPIRIAIN